MHFLVQITKWLSSKCHSCLGSAVPVRSQDYRTKGDYRATKVCASPSRNIGSFIKAIHGGDKKEQEAVHRNIRLQTVLAITKKL